MLSPSVTGSQSASVKTQYWCLQQKNLKVLLLQIGWEFPAGRTSPGQKGSTRLQVPKGGEGSRDTYLKSFMDDTLPNVFSATQNSSTFLTEGWSVTWLNPLTSSEMENCGVTYRPAWWGKGGSGRGIMTAHWGCHHLGRGQARLRPPRLWRDE